MKASASEFLLHRESQRELVLFCDPNRNIIIFAIMFNNSLTPANDVSVDEKSKIDEITRICARTPAAHDA
jgi:hypothetical protein